MPRKTCPLLMLRILGSLVSGPVRLLTFRRTPRSVVPHARSLSGGYLATGMPPVVSPANQRRTVVRKQPAHRSDESEEHDADAYLDERRRNQTVSSPSEIKASLTATPASAPLMMSSGLM